MPWTKEDEITGKWRGELGLRKDILRYYSSNLYPVLFKEPIISNLQSILKDAGNFVEKIDINLSSSIEGFNLRTTELPLSLGESISSDVVANLNDFVLRTTLLTLPLRENISVNTAVEINGFYLTVVLVPKTESETLSVTTVAEISSFNLA